MSEPFPSDLIGVFTTLDEDEWICYRGKIVRNVCLDECGEELMIYCWGEEPRGGMKLECSTLFCHICWDYKEEEPIYVPK